MLESQPMPLRLLQEGEEAPACPGVWEGAWWPSTLLHTCPLQPSSSLVA